jgi:hypothetical protein
VFINRDVGLLGPHTAFRRSRSIPAAPTS